MAQQVRASCESGVEDFTDWILDYYSGIKRGTISSLYLRTGNKSGSQFPSEGETLSDRLRKGPLPLEQLLKCGIEICAGLEKAHRNGIVHRDLKPGNVMLTKPGAKLVDFGLARIANRSRLRVPLQSASQRPRRLRSRLQTSPRC